MFTFYCEQELKVPDYKVLSSVESTLPKIVALQSFSTLYESQHPLVTANQEGTRRVLSPEVSNYS